MSDPKALYVPMIEDGANIQQIVKSHNISARIINSLIRNGQLTRTGQDAYVIGGGGGPPLDVASGGTGDSTLTAHSVLIGEGTSPVGFAGPGAVRTVLQGMGASADPAFTANPEVEGLLFYDLVSAVVLTVSLQDGVLVFDNSGLPLDLSFGTTLNFEGVSSALVINGNVSSASSIRLGEQTTNGANEISLRAPVSIATDFNFNLPATAGTSGQVLTSAGGGSSPMTWTTYGSFTGSYPQVTVAGTGATDQTGILFTQGGNNRWDLLMLSGTSDFVLYDRGTNAPAITVQLGTSAVTLAGTLSIANLTLNSPTSTAQTNLTFAQGGNNRWDWYAPASSIDFKLYNRNLAADALIVTASNSRFAFVADVKVGTGLGVWGTTPPGAQPTVTGSRGGNAALASLLTALAATGLIVDGSSP